MKFDLLSDVHLDETLIISMEEYVQKLLPENPSDILVFAGDFGYSNEQNISFIKELKKTYGYILFILGNNDIKIPLKENGEYHSTTKRVKDFQEKAKQINGVIYLNNKTITINGITFTGSDIFYDFETLKKRFEMTDEEILNEWKRKKLDQKHGDYIKDPNQYTKELKKVLFSNIENSNVIITHAPPHFVQDKNDHDIGFFAFDAEEIIDKIADKVWCFGHKHKRYKGTHYGCNFHNASYFNHENEKIITIECQKTW